MSEIVAVFDTNSLPLAGPLNTNFWRSIFQLCKTTGIEPVLPEIVLHESMNLRMTRAAEATENLYSAINQLSKFTDAPSVYLPSVEDMGRDWEYELRSTFTVVPISGDDALEALKREALRQPPARGGVGARDSAIWLTASRLASQGKVVNLISKNTKDFASDAQGGLHPKLQDDLLGAEGSVKYFTSIRGFMDSIATKVPAPALKSHAAQDVFSDVLREVALEYLQSDDLDVAPEKVAISQARLSAVSSSTAYLVSDTILALVTGEATLVSEDGNDLLTLNFDAWVNFEPNGGPPTSAEIIESTLK
ncbi:PIN domain-containing protein [Arthrobacter sp. YD4]|uniref:PIN domain-containing protein n=1 Tax=Arthrobacter sp. YD4 TaxID=3058043 RepID=UPI0025B5F884|nr:PIN domain-containing protein [Arthrobacter sp. YD4]MDN3936636.1 PIN domain-containing protein [Arthrobacter sp. YD4]